MPAPKAPKKIKRRRPQNPSEALIKLDKTIGKTMDELQSSVSTMRRYLAQGRPPLPGDTK